MHNNPATNGGSAGFSLVETLVSLSIFSLLSIVMLGAFRQIAPLDQASKIAGERVELNTIADFLADTLEQAIPVSRTDTGEIKRRVAFEGTSSNVRFAGRVRVGSDETRLQAISIEVFANSEGSQLWLETTPRRASQVKPGTRELLAEDLANVKFEFLAAPGTLAAGWSDQWTRSDQIPFAVRLTLKSKTAGPGLMVRRTILLRNRIQSLR